MPAVEITPADLAPFATIDAVKATAMIDDALARAALVAPCILSDDFAHAGAAKAIIRGAILRWNDSGSGAYTTEQTGPFAVTMDTRVERKGMFLLSELDELKALCPGGTSKAFAIDTAPGAGPHHAPWCSLAFGATYCSCGADLSGGGPIFGEP